MMSGISGAMTLGTGIARISVLSVRVFGFLALLKYRRGEIRA